VRPRRLTLGCVVLAGLGGGSALAASGSGPAWCGTRADASRDAVLAHREQAGRRGVRIANASSASVFRAGDIAVMQDQGGDLALVANRLDLGGAALRFSPRGAGMSVSRVNMALLGDAGTPLPLDDDDSEAATLPFAFPFYGGSYTSVFVNSDGNLTFRDRDSASTDRNVGRLVSGPPRVAPFLTDLDPSQGGSVSVGTAADRFTVTWTNVPRFEQNDRNTFQVSLFPDGRIDFVYSSDMGDPEEGAVGIAPGGNTGGVTGVDFSQAADATSGGALVEGFRFQNAIDTLAVARRFYSAFPDEFQQLVVYSNRRLTARNTFAYEQTVRNDAGGTGAQVFDRSRDYGSGGRLESFVYMDDIDKYVEPLESPFLGADSTLSVLAHEVGHRWLANAVFQDGSRISDELLGRDQVHWNFFMDSDGSHDEGNDIEDLGGGQFRTVGASRRYGPLDQYLMGLRPASEVPPFFVVRNPTGTFDTDPGRDPETGVTFGGTRKDVTIADVQAAMGPRNPSVDRAPKEIREAFILVAVGGPPTQAQIDKVERIRAAWAAFYSRSTDGRGTADPRLQ
jgi:hypothetical protein